MPVMFDWLLKRQPEDRSGLGTAPSRGYDFRYSRTVRLTALLREVLDDESRTIECPFLSPRNVRQPLCLLHGGDDAIDTLPEYTRSFGGIEDDQHDMKVSNDPLISNYGLKDTRRALAKWFYHGEHIGRVTKILNKNHA